jgi:pilus assembly protein CpaB
VTAALEDRLPEPARRLLRHLAWHRRWVAAGATALAVAGGLSVLAPRGPALVRVVAAAKDLPAGAVLADADLATVGLPAGAVPDGAVLSGASARGRVLAGPVRRGEPVTDVRLVGAALVGSLDDGLVATPVRLADAGIASFLRSGDRVDVLAAATGETGPAAAGTVATGVRVLAVPALDDTSVGGSLDGGALVVLATTRATAALLARAEVASRLSVTIVG